MVSNWDQIMRSQSSVLRAAILHQRSRTLVVEAVLHLAHTLPLQNGRFAPTTTTLPSSLSNTISPLLHERRRQCSDFKLHGHISCFFSAPFLYSVDLIRPSQVPQIPIRQPSPHLRLTNMDQVPLERIIKLIRIHHLAIQQSPFTPPHLPTPLFVYQ